MHNKFVVIATVASTVSMCTISTVFCSMEHGEFTPSCIYKYQTFKTMWVKRMVSLHAVQGKIQKFVHFQTFLLKSVCFGIVIRRSDISANCAFTSWWAQLIWWSMPHFYCFSRRFVCTIEHFIIDYGIHCENLTNLMEIKTPSIHFVKWFASIIPSNSKRIFRIWTFLERIQLCKNNFPFFFKVSFCNQPKCSAFSYWFNWFAAWYFWLVLFFNWIW